jgi:hypothetical protein
MDQGIPGKALMARPAMNKLIPVAIAGPLRER